MNSGNAAKTGFIPKSRLSGRLSKRARAMKRIYNGLCENGCNGEVELYFADNYHTVASAAAAYAGNRESRRDTPKIYCSSEDSPAKRIITESGERLPNTEEIFTIIRDSASCRRIYGSEVEYLDFLICCELIKQIYTAIKSRSRDVIRLMKLLADLDSLDIVRINDVMNPTAIALSADQAYSKSDVRTRREYREAIYKTAVRYDQDEIVLIEELLDKYRGSDLDIDSLAVRKQGRLSDKSAALIALILSICGAALAVLISVLIGAPIGTAFLVLPAIEALRPISDHLISRRCRPRRLMRLEPSSEEVRSTRAAIVLSAAVFEPEDAEALYDKLLGLYCLNPGENVLICALLDLPAEQVPITSEDRAMLESLGETAQKLERISEGRFSLIVRKRSFSETQQEYMGKNRKRGALLDLARYMAFGESDFYAGFGGWQNLRGVDWICAVDSDTLPLMDTLPELLAIALHPMNRVKVKNGFVTRGYGVIAPRMVTRLRDSLRSEFSKSLGGIGSRSSYDEESANLYQDVFGAGTFCGKGLINVTTLLECTAPISGERILSHDILEGELMHTAYAGDIIFTEGFPRTPQSYYRRLDRWIRGDFQNIPELFKPCYSKLSKVKLLDNLRRAATPISVFAAFWAGFFLPTGTAGLLAAAALLLWLAPPIYGALNSVLRGGGFSRRFYSGLLSTTSQSLRYIFYSILTLPALAIKSLRAILTALWRLMSGKNLLEWTTADSSDRAGASPLVYYFLPELVGAALIWSPDYFIRLMGAVFAAMPAVLSLGSPASVSEPRLKYRDTRELSKQFADMWGFFESYTTELDNDLPPDNVQFAPVYRIAHRTSPTNIGLYLMSVLAAYDRKLIGLHAMVGRIERTLNTIDRLEKYRGNLYNWYDTKTLKICPTPYVSSVDSGNFICCLVVLKEGLKEIEGYEKIKSLIARIGKIIDNSDLSAFYDPVRGLMSIGIDPSTGEQSPSHYDCLMSEARLTSFWAIASRQVPKSHWQRLSRAMLSCGFFGGAASYSGTMFEYFMPEIFLKSPEGSVSGESLRYCLYVQKKYSRSLGRPYGISESGYYSFDPVLNYRYMAHGVPRTGIRRGLESNYVVSPYSTYISLGYSVVDGPQNLRELSKLGMYGSFGLYEALDFTPAGSDGGPEAVRSYMAHHVGMSLCALDNVLNGGIMQKRFLRDMRVRGALELLDERFYLGAAVFENTLRRPRLSAPPPREHEIETIENFDLSHPRVKLICNGEMTLSVADNGATSLSYRSKNVYLRTRDLMRPKGSFNFVSDGGDAVPFGYLMDMRPGGTVEFGEDYAAFYRNTKKLSAGLKLGLADDRPCELRTFALKNETNEPLNVSVISYIDPSLLSDAAEESHPVFSKMFLRLERDPEWKLVTVSREGEKGLFAAIGFIEEVNETVSFDRSEVLKRPEGIAGLMSRFKEISPSLISEPDPCIFIRASLTLPPKSEAELTMFIVCAGSKDELINIASGLRRKKPALSADPRLDTPHGRVASALLPEILFRPEMSSLRREAIEKNKLSKRALWELSLSTEIPIVLVCLNEKNDAQKLSSYLGAYKLLRLAGIELQLVFAFDDGGRYEREHYYELISAAREMGLEGSVYSSGGILPLDLKKTRDGLLGLLTAAACHVCIDEIASFPKQKKTRRYLRIRSSEPRQRAVDEPVACGGFSGEGYVINTPPPLPWCHILSNQVFGTLVSEGSLGFSFAFNSRENRLTPWDNDPARDNTGERLILFAEGKAYDLIRGAAAVFKPYSAEYYSKGSVYEADIKVEVSGRGMCKKISTNLKLKTPARLCYYVEPCMGVSREGSEMILPVRIPSGVTFESLAGSTPEYMTISTSAPPESISVTTSRHAFFTGDTSESVRSETDLIGAVCVNVENKVTADFYLSFGLTQESAEKMPELFCPQSDTREHKVTVSSDYRSFDRLVNTWLRYQALHARIYARTGFWQCSGAYGFRDQLQDAVGIIAENPNVCKVQILRCCCAQFIEGDVLHWWHCLPGQKIMGIRTRISDDPLWLPYAVCEYVKKTGDFKILDLRASYCGGLELLGDRERYGEVYKTATRETVYEHCRRAIDLKLGKIGRNGLMLIGTGDWNDGFGEVGKDGEGESVWLSEFSILVFRRFAEIARALGDIVYADKLSEMADMIAGAVERSRDGEWYLRATFDDGTPIGSRKCRECKIDSISQSFAEFADLGGDGFARIALMSAYSELADVKRGVIKLFSPPFKDSADPNPGYISSYPEGLRENGGQYTHAAVWLGLALLKNGLSAEGEAVLKALDPIEKSKNGGWEKYKTEPYYLCGDVYSNKNCLGRGGWSIYTGSAAWYYRAITEGLMGLRQESGGFKCCPSPIDAVITVDGKKVR